MKGIYLTQQGKEEIEAKIAELEKIIPLQPAHYVKGEIYTRELLKEILSSSTILPVEESWDNVKDMLDINTLPISYKQGVIIKPK